MEYMNYIVYRGGFIMKVSSYVDKKFILENVEGNTIADVIHSVIAIVSG